MARVVVYALAAAVVVFCIVQDRMTAAAARRYVQLHRAAAGGAAPPPIDAVMRPAVQRSVGGGLLSAGVAAGVALGAGALWTRSAHRE